MSFALQTSSVSTHGEAASSEIKRARPRRA